MYLTEVEERQIDLYESVFDSNLKMLENFDAIMMMESAYDDVYFEGAGEMVKKVGDFFKALLNKFKEFVESVAKAVKEKINEIKQKHIINKIEKSGLKSVKKIKLDGVDVCFEKELKKEAVEYIKLGAEASKKLSSAKSVEEVTKIYNEFQSKYDSLYEKKRERYSKCNTIGDLDWDPASISACAWVNQLLSDTMTKLEQEVEKNEFYVEKLAQDRARYEEELRKMEEIQVSKQKTNVFKRIASKVAGAFKNIQSKFTKTQLAVLGAIVATATAAVAGKKIYDNHKTVKESVEDNEHSGYDSFDDILSDLDMDF